jgi:putative tryptophan/tyrosine transport system substrate-binding protein
MTCIGRREFITLLGGAAAAWPLAAIAQRSAEVRRVGVLANEPWPPLEGLRDEMRALGYIDERGLHFEYRFAEGRAERYTALAAELVRLPAHAIVAWGTQASLAAKQATGTVPIVMISGDPIAVGLVPGLAYPGANVTGLSTLAADLEGKRIELLKELLANLARVAVLSNPTDPFCIVAVESARAAATALHLDLKVVEAAEERDLDRAFLTLSRQRPDAVLTVADPFLTSQKGARRRLHDREPVSVDVHLPRGCFGRRSHFLCDELLRRFPARSDLDRQDPEGRQARRPANSAADQIRAGNEPQYLEGAGP